MAELISERLGRSKRVGMLAHSTRVSRLKRYLSKHIYFYLLLILPLTYLIVFRYGPMVGASLAFKRFNPATGLFGGAWVGFKYFRIFFKNDLFWRALKNTFSLSGKNLIIIFWIPIIFALVLNECRNILFKKFVQTVSFLPFFITVVVVCSMVKELLSPTGFVNNILMAAGREKAVQFLSEPRLFHTIYVTSYIWQNMGYTAIVYIAALSNIDPQLYESVEVDGGGSWRKIIHISIPGIAPTMVVILLLMIGKLLQLGFERILLLYNEATRETADILSSYVFRTGIVESNFSYATAIGLFNALLCLVMLTIANRVARRVMGMSLW
jgi:putative aldouronate transport system permease protein